MMTVKSLKSQGYLTEVFNWQWSYYAVTDKGVGFLAKALAVSSDVVPATMKKKVVTVTKVKAADDGEKATPDGEGETAGAGRGSR